MTSAAIDHGTIMDNQEERDPMHGPGNDVADEHTPAEIVPVYLRDQFRFNQKQKRLEPLDSALRELALGAAQVFNDRNDKVNGVGNLTRGLNLAHDALGSSWAKNAMVYGMAKVAAKEICGQVNRICSLELSLQRARNNEETDQCDKFENMIEESETSLDSAILIGRWVESCDVKLNFDVGSNDALWMEANRQTKMLEPTDRNVSNRGRSSVLSRLSAGH